MFHAPEGFIGKTHTLIHMIRCVIPLFGGFQTDAVFSEEMIGRMPCTMGIRPFMDEIDLMGLRGISVFHRETPAIYLQPQ